MEELYHYCPLNKAIEFILPEKRLLLNPLVNTNDPWENKAFIYFGGKSKYGVDSSIIKNNEPFTKILKEDCKILCFSEGSNFSMKDGKEYYVSGFGYPNMWAHYADNHKGVCIILDKNKFINENQEICEKSMLRKVRYVEPGHLAWTEIKMIDYDRIKLIGKSEYLLQEFRPNELEYLFYTKTIDWERESETRLVHFSKKNEPEYCSIKESIIGVAVGLDFNINYLPSLKQYLKGKVINSIKYVNGLVMYEKSLNSGE